MSVGRGLYRALLRLLPPEFRARHEREMRVLLEEALEDARRRGGGLRAAGVWTLALADLVGCAARLRWRGVAAAGAGLLGDAWLSLRSLRRSPGFTAVAVATLALGIGANTAMFSVLRAVVLRPLPYGEPERLVRVWPTKNFNAALAALVGEEAGTLTAVTGIAGWRFTLLGEGEPEEIAAAVVGVDHFRMLGVRPALGRDFLPEEGHPDRSDVVILSHGFWLRRFGGDPNVLGRRIRMDAFGQHPSWVVVAVLGPDFQAVEPDADVFVPLALAPGSTVATDNTWYVNRVIARLAPGATVEQADAEVRRVAVLARERFPGLVDEEEVRSAGVTPLVDELIGPARGVLWMLLGAVGLVLLIACANLANLLLARSARRARDLTIRTALGASRQRLVRHTLTESLVLGALGGAVAIPLALATLALLVPAVAAQLPRAAAATLDAPVLAFTFVLSLISAVAFGIAPALAVGRTDLQPELQSGGRGTAGRAPRHRLSRGLVVAQVALTVVLVTGAGLLLRSFHALVSQDPGFRHEGVVTVSVTPPYTRYASDDARRIYFDALLERVAAVPGVEEVSGIHLLPLTSANWNFPYLAEGHPPQEDAPLPSAQFRIVAPGYFEMMGIGLLRGRTFSAADGLEDARVGIVNERMARLLWPDGEPLGREIQLFGNQPFTVVGVVGDVRQFALDRASEPEMYFPHRQYPWAGLHLLVRADGDAAALAPALREAVWSIDHDVAVPAVRDLSAVFAESVAEPRLYALLLGVFGALALALGALGVYGVMSYLVGTRLAEFGVRLALGARSGAVVRGALADGLAPVALGIAVGLAAAAAGARVLRGLLFQVEPTDPLTYLAVVAVLVAVAGVAAWLPARRAGRVDPMAVLSAE